MSPAGTRKTHWRMVVRAVNLFTVTGHPPQAWLSCNHRGLWGLCSLPFVLCPHIPAVFPYSFPISRISLPPPPVINIPPKKFYTGLLILSFPNTGSCSLVPCDIFSLFSCSPKPLGYPQLQGHVVIWTSSVIQKTKGNHGFKGWEKRSKNQSSKIPLNYHLT